MSLYLRYHPTSLSGVVGHAPVIQSLRRILNKSDREAFWFAGPSGCGKTTIAQALAAELCDKRDVTQIAGTKCGVDTVEEIEQNFYYSTWGASGWKAVIVNEAHKITDRAVDAWLTLLDPDASGAFRHKRLVLFTSTFQKRCRIFLGI